MRVQTDNSTQPFDTNEGAKLELGSTAKLRTLTTYLEIIASLHEQYSGDDARRRCARSRSTSATASRAGRSTTCSARRTRSLAAMLEAAMERRYSASPGESVLHRRRRAHLLELQARGRRQVAVGARSAARIDQPRVHPHHARRRRTTTSTARPDNTGTRAAGPAPSRPRRLPLALRRSRRPRLHPPLLPQVPGAEARRRSSTSCSTACARRRIATRSSTGRSRPKAGVPAFAKFMRARFPGSDAERRRSRVDVREIRRRQIQPAGPRLSRAHPSARAVAGRVPAPAPRREVGPGRRSEPRRAPGGLPVALQEQGESRRRTRASARCSKWKRSPRSTSTGSALGYPFGALVPSYATAIGVSGDRPAALAELMGIIVNGGATPPGIGPRIRGRPRCEPFRTTEDSP